MKEHVYSTQFVLRSSYEGESLDSFYLRLRRFLFTYAAELYNDESARKFSEADFLEEDAALRIVTEECSILTNEAALDGDRAFMLKTSVPRMNKYFKNASDHSLCTETIARMFKGPRIGGKECPHIQVSVRSWVEYQPFAGFFKTRKLPRCAPDVVELLAQMQNVQLLFLPRLVSSKELEKVPLLKKYPRLIYPVLRGFKTVEDAKTLEDFKGHLVDPTRPIPLVVFFGDSARCVREARGLSERCWSKCRVWVLKKNVPGLADLLEHTIEGINVKRNFRFGLCRVFFPRGHYRQDDAAQPAYWVPVVNRHHFRKRTTIGLLRFFRLDDRGWITSERDLTLFEYELKVDDKLKENTDMREKVKVLLAERQDLQNSLDDTKRQLADANLAGEEIVEESLSAITIRDDLQQENARLQAEIAALRGRAGQSTFEAANMTSLCDDEDSPPDFDTLVWASQRMMPHLAFVPVAWSGMDRKKKNSRFVSELWSMLCSLEKELMPMLQNPTMKDVPQRYKDKTGYEFIPKDSSDLPPDMEAKRHVEFEGRQWYIGAHIKSGNRDATLLRAYFAFDQENDRLIIGHVGDHLPSIGTLKNS